MAWVPEFRILGPRALGKKWVVIDTARGLFNWLRSSVGILLVAVTELALTIIYYALTESKLVHVSRYCRSRSIKLLTGTAPGSRNSLMSM